MRVERARRRSVQVGTSWNSLSCPGLGGLFPPEDVAQPCASPRVQFVSSREDTRRRVPFRSGPGSRPQLSPSYGARLSVWSLSWSPAIFLDQTGSRLRRPRPSSGTILRRGKQVWWLLWGRGDTIDDRFFFFLFVGWWTNKIEGVDESFGSKICWIKFYTYICEND